MIKVDENDPIGEIQLSFPYRDVKIKVGEDPKDFYTLEEEVGRGKFGTVYRCTEKSTGMCLAAKFIACPKKEDKKNVEREIEIMRTLQHPRLIQMYDAFENGKIMTVILELIEGGELFERIIDDDFILTEKSCTIFMRQICEGVDFMHKQRILHLDMKPENVLCLTKTGNRIKIIDFGLARKFDPNKKLQVLFGTPEFVAPEVVNFDAIGYGTDVWSVGVICYVLLSGLSPFMGHTDAETMANVTIAKYDFDDEAFDEISENAKDFIRKLLIKDMNKRMSPEQCLNHPWLRRQPVIAIKKTPSMEVTKDNLKQFVGRWNEHPNSPYVFEINSNFTSLPSATSDGRSISESSESLLGDSPSPCGSLTSLPGSDIHGGIEETPKFLSSSPTKDYLRRASDSTGLAKSYDVAERMNLAEEIKKLSEKLFQLSNFDPKPCHCDGVPINITDTDVTRNIPIRLTGVKYSEATSSPDSNNCAIPWRRPKMKLSNTSRDVPLSVHIHKSPDGQFTSKTNSRFTTSPNGTKDLLLHFLNYWEGPKAPTRPNNRHGSVSSEWTEHDSLGQRTISSLNNFFQSRAVKKHNVHFQN